MDDSSFLPLAVLFIYSHSLEYLTSSIIHHLNLQTIPAPSKETKLLVQKSRPDRLVSPPDSCRLIFLLKQPTLRAKKHRSIKTRKRKSNMFDAHPVPIVYATGPIRKPKPIKLVTDPDGRIQSVPHTPIQALPPQGRHKRPVMLRAATLDGRSLSEVIDAAHRASLNEQPKSRSSKSPMSIYERPSSDSRRTSLHYPQPASSRSSNYHRRLSSYEHRPDNIAFDAFSYEGLA